MGSIEDDQGASSLAYAALSAIEVGESLHPSTLPAGTRAVLSGGTEVFAIGTPRLIAGWYHGGWPVGLASLRADLVDWSTVVPGRSSLHGNLPSLIAKAAVAGEDAVLVDAPPELLALRDHYAAELDIFPRLDHLEWHVFLEALGKAFELGVRSARAGKEAANG